MFEFWPSTLIAGCHVMVVKAIKVKSAPPLDGQQRIHSLTTVLDELWVNPRFAETVALDTSAIAHKFGHSSSEGEEITEFVMKVCAGDFFLDETMSVCVVVLYLCDIPMCFGCAT
jgi:hypothetical protein